MLILYEIKNILFVYLQWINKYYYFLLFETNISVAIDGVPWRGYIYEIKRIKSK